MEDDPFGPLTGGSREAWSQSQDIDEDPNEEQEIVVATPAAPKPTWVQEVLRTPKKAAKKPEGRKPNNNELLQTILNNTELPQLKWESEDPQRINRLSIKELAPFIEKFRVIEKSECNFEKYDWPKPAWEWPRSPDWIPASHKQCDICHDEGYDRDNEGRCNCIHSCLPEIQPRITNEPVKGQGVRAIDVAYTKDQIPGELLGEFAPLNTFNDEWTMVLTREDLDEPIAQLWTKEVGGWVRKTNYSCESSAKFCEMRISGFWRVMLVAIRDIPLGGEITAFCGADFLRDQGIMCHCDKCDA